MTEKRFILEEFGLNFIVNDNGRNLTAKQTVDRLNELNDENEQLKSENEDMRRLINNISHQRDEFHRGARENANHVGKLKKENEQLKKQLQEFRVEKSNRINAFCVTNDEYSVVLLNENEAYMVCNMANRLIRSCKND